MPRKRIVDKESKKNDNLSIFKQHGFIIENTSGDDQVFGNCIFCGSEDKFYVSTNSKNKDWDCKVCGLQGGYKIFLKELYQNGVDIISTRQLRRLAENRSLRVSTLKAHDVGYNPVTDCYIFPEWDLNNEDILDVRIYNFKTLYSSKGSTPGLYGGHTLNLSNENDFDVIWLVEGHWDKMAMWEILTRLGKQNQVVVSVPGAGTFRDEWISLFKGKDVKVVYDNDPDRKRGEKIIPGSGKAGMIKVYEKLYKETDSIEFIHWLHNYPDKFDIRALLIKKMNSPVKTYKVLINNFESKPPDYDIFGKNQIKVETRKFDGEGCSIEEVYDVFNSYLKLINNYIIDVTYATVVANRLIGTPVWIYLVGPSGCGKSEIIMSLDDYKYTEATSTLTSASLISGKRNDDRIDTSLIPRLDGKIFTIKDFTTILNMNPTTRTEIVGLLRDAYDGQCAKEFGGGFKKAYKSKFGMIAGVTHAIEIYSEGLTALGERFLKFNIPIDESLQGERDVCEMVMQNVLTGNQNKMKEELKAVGAKFLNFEFKDTPELPIHLQKKIISLSQWCGMMRGTVTRHFRTERITHFPMKEYVTRLTSNFTMLTLGLAMIHRKKEVDDSHYEIVKHIAQGTPPQNNTRIVSSMIRAGKSMQFTAGDMSEMVGLPSNTTKFVSEDLTMLKVFKKVKQKIDSSGFKNKWVLTDDILNLMEQTGVV